MTPLQAVWFMIVLLPSYIFMDGVGKLNKFMKKHPGGWEILLYSVTALLCFLTLYLIAMGYPLR